MDPITESEEDTTPGSNPSISYGGPHRKKILLLAYACSPYQGSEAGVGWHRAVQAARFFDTWVLCKKKTYEEDIQRWQSANGEISGLHFVFVPQSRFERTLKTIPGFYYLAYNLWHRRAYKVAVELHREIRFDLTHQVTMCGFREPGYLWKFGIPFVWGPVGGTQNYPWRFLSVAGFRGALKEAVRSIVNNLQFRFSPRVGKAMRNAKVLLAANSTGMRDFREVHGVEPIRELEAGLPAVSGVTRAHRRKEDPINILWSGIFESHKGLPLLLKALGELPPHIQFELRILGHGLLEHAWRSMAKKLGVDACCRWMGWLPHSEALAQYQWADVFVFTSLRDTSGNVFLEALSHGVPIISIDHQGVGDVVTPECGIKIPLTCPAEVIRNLRDAIAELAGDREKIERLSRGALERAEAFLWSRKGERMAEIYGKAISHGEGDQIPRERTTDHVPSSI